MSNELTFGQWKQIHHPGWYLNNQEEDENLFEEYLKWRKENEHGQTAAERTNRF